MDVKRPQRLRVLALYRASAAVNPSADIDAFILSAARAARVPARRRRDAFIALAAAVVVAVAFFARLSTTGAPGAADNDFGIAEGQDRAYLLTFDFQTPTGFAAEELP
jgi:hypothetical protein